MPSRPRVHPRRPLLPLAVACSLAACHAAAVAADAPVVSPAVEAGRLQGDMKRTKTAAERQKIAERLLTLGADGGRRLLPLARGELAERLPRYSVGFQRAAAAVLAGRFGKQDPWPEIESLRRTIRDTAAAGDLSKQMIEQRSDPALARLEKLLVVTPADVLAADAKLAADRQELLALADWIERSAALVPEKDRARLGPIPSRAEISAQLDDADQLTAVLALPLGPADRQTLTANAAIARTLDPAEARGIQRLNQIRVLVGLPPQAIDTRLVAACRTHSEDMSTRGFFSHDSPVAGRETPWKRARAAGTSASAENIASGMSSGEEAIKAWWHSPGHHKNLLDKQQRTGLGRHKRHWTQLFG